MKKYYKPLLILAVAFSSFSQPVLLAQPKFDKAGIMSKYSTYNAVFLLDEESYLIDIVNSELKVEQNTKQQILSLNEAGVLFSQNRVYYSSFTTIEKLEANTWVPAGNGYRLEKVKEFTDTDARNGSVFYDDIRVIKFSYPSLGKGSITSLKYKTIYNDPRFITPFFMRENIPVDMKRVVLKVNKDIELKYRVINGDKIKYNFRVDEKGKYRIYEWTAEECKPYKTSDPDDLLLYYSPHIVFHIGKYTVNGKDSIIFQDESDLYQYYYSLVSGVENKCTDEMHELTTLITRNLNTNREKAAAILTWVQDNIKYVAFEDGMRGFIPNPAQEVFQKRYGDCKDMASLIRQMLECIDIEAYYSWVGTRDIPYRYSEVPTPKTDNHMVAVMIENDSALILDGTIDQMIFGHPPVHLQGKELLVGLGKDNFRIYKIPVMPETYSNISDSVIINIDGSGVSGRGWRSFTGYNRFELARLLDGVEPDRIKRGMTGVLTQGNNKFFLDSVILSEFRNREPQIKVMYNFRVGEYVSSYEDEIYVNLNLQRPLMEMKADTSISEIPVYNDFYFTEDIITILDIPDGYDIEHIPGNTDFFTDRFGFTISYQKLGRQIELRKSFKLDLLMLEDKEIDNWNKMIDLLAKSYRETVVLKKNNNKINSDEKYN